MHMTSAPRYIPYPNDLHYLGRLSARLRELETTAHDLARASGNIKWREFGDRCALRRKQVRQHVGLQVELPFPRTARPLTY